MSCPDCFRGSTHEGTPAGTVTKIHDLDVYISEPSNQNPLGRGIIVMIPDVYGWQFINNQLLADRLAQRSGLRVYLPEFMQGNSGPTWLLDTMRKFFSADSNMFVTGYNMFWSIRALLPFTVFTRVGRSHPVVKNFFIQLRQAEGQATPIGAVGYCWGGKHVVLLAQQGSDAVEMEEGQNLPLIDAGFTGHPAWLEIPGDVEKLKRPVSFALGDKDASMPLAEAAKIKAKVEALPLEARGEAVIYENCGHGFCSRADIMVKESDISAKVEAAEIQCVDWFNQHFQKRSARLQV